MSVKTFAGACRLAVAQCERDDYQIADAIGICHGHMSRVMKGTAGLHGQRLVAFMRETNSIEPLRWLAAEMGCELVEGASTKRGAA